MRMLRAVRDAVEGPSSGPIMPTRTRRRMSRAGLRREVRDATRRLTPTMRYDTAKDNLDRRAAAYLAGMSTG